MNDSGRSALPTWLTGPSVAIIAAVFTVGVGIAGLILASHSGLRTEMHNMREDLGGDIERVRSDIGARITALDTRLRDVRVDVAVIRESVEGVDARLRIVERHTHDPPHMAPIP